jgi:type IV pilus assembly protein PilV
VAGAGRYGRGFTMVEAMVALVVLAIGLLGIARLYAVTLRSGGSAIYRMQAVSLAVDLADRIRANPGANVAYAGAASLATICYGAGSVDCAPARMAADDLLVWNQQLATQLPAGTGTVVVAGAAVPYTYTITVNWTEPTQTTPISYVLNIQI